MKVLGIPEVIFDWCRYGQQFRKRTRLISDFPQMGRLARKCNHKEGHVALKGTATTKAGAYSGVFCQQVAKLCWDFWPWNHMGNEPPKPPKVMGNEPQTSPVKNRKPASPLWAVQLSESLPWKPYMQYTFKHVSHINLQETKARRSVIKRLPHSRRVVLFQDSRVNLGSLGKGRSPSLCLLGLMRQEAPYILGKNLYLAGVHLPTWSIRADGPSRKRLVDPPCVAIPKWFWQLRTQKIPLHDVLADLEGLPRAVNRWMVFTGKLLLLVSSRGSATSSSASQSRPSETRPDYREDQSVSPRLAGEVWRLAGTPARNLYAGYFGPEAHRSFIRILRRIHLASVHHGSVTSGSSRDAQHAGAKLWLAEALTCRALEYDQVLGKPGTINISSTNSSACAACICGLCTGLAMAKVGGDFGAWLFCFVETSRVYWATASRLGAVSRSSRRRCPVCAHRGPKDPVSRGQKPACSCGRAGFGLLDRVDSSLYSDVATYLERITSCLQGSF